VKMVDMTKEALDKIIKDMKLYRTYELNDTLWLHYKGFRKIENLDPFTGLKVLWLEGNGLQKIEGLDKLTNLRTLYLHENCIEKMENMSQLNDLRTLNLSENIISKVECISTFSKLATLNLSKNRISTAEDLSELKTCPSITCLDIQKNNIENPEILDVLVKALPNLKVLYLQGNKVVKAIKHYRKMVTCLFPSLTYLDDRPIFPEDRLRAEAWKKGFDAAGGYEGGKEAIKAAREAEKKEIVRQREEKKAKEEANFQAFGEMIRKAKEEHAAKVAAGLVEQPTSNPFTGESILQATSNSTATITELTNEDKATDPTSSSMEVEKREDAPKPSSSLPPPLPVPTNTTTATKTESAPLPPLPATDLD